MSKTVLVADDSASVRQIVSMVLKSSGYTVIEAENGQKALEQLDGKKIHLIVSDVNMPEMDGLTFIENARKVDEYKFTPILMLTTETDQSLKDRGKAQGIKAWLVKPFQPPVFMSAISKLT